MAQSGPRFCVHRAGVKHIAQFLLVITPEEAGSLFARLKPKLAAYTHLVFLGSPAYPAPKVADIERNTRSTYSGPLALGTDLMAFDVRNDQVIVIPDASKK